VSAGAALLARPRTGALSGWWHRGQRDVALLGVVVLAGAVFAATNDIFLTGGNLRNIGVQSSMILLVALGMTVVIIAGGIDLSVGSCAALVSVTAVGLSADHGVAPALAVVAGLAVGLAVGLLNGAMVSLVRIPDFIATLGTLTALRGLAFIASGGFAIRSTDPRLSWFGSGEIAGLPAPVVLTVVAFVLVGLMLRTTTLGRAFFAVGGNRETARLAGLNVGRTTAAAYVACALFAALAGLVLTGRTGSGSPQAASGWELQAVAIAILGGTNLFGGRGGVVGTLLAGLFIGMLNNWLSLQGYESWIGDVLLGSLLIAVIALNERERRRRARASARPRRAVAVRRTGGGQ
jgi:ribose/xylose/arabinose/galactoside ABC-type transport system permease subunit